VATGGWASAKWDGAHSVYLFEPASGRLVRRIPDLPSSINHLTYSLDGRYLVAALGGKNGVRLYDTRDWREVARDSDYGEYSSWAAFDRRGRLVTSCGDGFVRLYDANFRRLAQRRAPGGKRPFAVRFAPDGTEVAVGFQDTTAVNVLSGEDLSFRYAPDTSGVNNGNLARVAWSRDRRLLYAGGQYRDRTGIHFILQWSQAGRGAATTLATSTNTITDLRTLAHGRLVFGAAAPAFGVFDANGTRVRARGPETVDYRDRHTMLRVSDDGSVVEFAFDTLTSDNRTNRHLARLHLAEGRVFHNPRPLTTGVAQVQQRLAELGYDPGPADGTLGPRTRAAIQAFQRARGLEVDGNASPVLQRALGIVELQAPRTTGLAIRDWYNSTHPTLDGTPLPLKQYEESRRLAIASDAAHFALSTVGSIRLFDRRGTQLWAVSTPSVPWAVNISGDGRFVLATFGDGTLRWYRLRDGTELLALFLHPDGKRWVLWTPQGFFHAAPGSETLIGYHLNQGADAAGEFVTVERLATLFSRPELVARRLEEGIEPSIREALARIGDVPQVLAGGLPPTPQLLSQPESQQNQRDFTFEFKIVDKGGGVGRVVYRVNGVVVGDPMARPMDISVPQHRRPFTLSPGRNVGWCPSIACIKEQRRMLIAH
jgi:peptidoglycan hydrolase-like protein with peptidoglycan-binding domain